MTKKYSNRITARARSKGRIRYTRQLTEAAIDALKASSEDTDKLNSFLGAHLRCERLLASDLRALYKAALFIERWFLKDRQQHPTRRYFFLTISDSDFLTDDASPIVSVEGFKRKINNTMRNLKDLSALVHFEMQAVCQYEGGARIIIPHAHGIAWTDNPEFDPVSTMAALNKAGHWHSVLGGRPLDILEIPNTEEDTRRAAHYLSKPIDSVKNRRRRKNGTPYQTDTRKGYRADLALRMAEGLSLIPVEDTYLGIRGGSPVRRDLMTHLRRWHAQRPQPAITPADFDIWEFWRRLRLTHGSPRLLPWRVDTQRPLCLPSGLYTLKAPAEDAAPTDDTASAQPDAPAVKVRFFDEVGNLLDDGVAPQSDPAEPEADGEQVESVEQPRRRRRRRGSRDSTSNVRAEASGELETDDDDDGDEELSKQRIRRRRKSRRPARNAHTEAEVEAETEDADEDEEKGQTKQPRRRRRRRKSQQRKPITPAETEAETEADEGEEEELAQQPRRRRRRKFQGSARATQPAAKTEPEEDDDDDDVVKSPRRRRRKLRKDTRGTPLETKRAKGGRGTSPRRSSGQRRR